MKKTVSSLTLILVGLFVVLSLLDIRGDYAVEEILWNANKRLSDAARTPEAVPDKVFEEIIAQYQRVIKGFPDSKLVPRAFIFLGRAYLVKKDYSTARQRLREVIGRFPKDDVNCVEALSAIGSSYELQGNWPEALKVYYEIKNDYPLTDLGLSVPLYIANHYTKNQQAANAISAFDAAESYYTQMADGHSNTPIEFKSLTLLSNCLLAQKKWTDVLVMPLISTIQLRLQEGYQSADASFLHDQELFEPTHAHKKAKLQLVCQLAFQTSIQQGSNKLDPALNHTRLVPPR